MFISKLIFAGIIASCIFSSLTECIEASNGIQEFQEKPGAVFFTPPSGWRMADADELSRHVSIMVVGKGQNEYPPSINLASEPYKGTLKDYLKIVKTLNDSQGYAWKDLGTIRTEAGIGSLSQVDFKSKWGEERLMHVILKKNDTIYIMTAGALKQEFSRFYPQFFEAFRSLRINPSIAEIKTDDKKNLH